ncbi:hypothetical protein SDC9_34416 [bioreactor metagenome]|uniref:Uncharacterized protein n=1 Tax=bioreactor metagenome TaxID=1076179 RepID=A0A644VAK4_9ZZZZ
MRRPAELRAEGGDEGARAAIAERPGDLGAALAALEPLDRRHQPQPAAPLPEGEPGLGAEQPFQRARARPAKGRQIGERARLVGALAQVPHQPHQPRVMRAGQAEGRFGQRLDLVGDDRGQMQPPRVEGGVGRQRGQPQDQLAQQRRQQQHRAVRYLPAQRQRWVDVEVADLDLGLGGDVVVGAARDPDRMAGRHDPDAAAAGHPQHPLHRPDQLAARVAVRLDHLPGRHPPAVHQHRARGIAHEARAAGRPGWRFGDILCHDDGLTQGRAPG